MSQVEVAILLGGIAGILHYASMDALGRIIQGKGAGAYVAWVCGGIGFTAMLVRAACALTQWLAPGCGG